MTAKKRQEVIRDILEDLRGMEPLKQLFWAELNYDRVNKPLSTRAWTETAKNALADDPRLFATGGADNAFGVIYARLASERLPLTGERAIISKLLNDHPYALFIFSNNAQDRWHFVNVKYEEKSERRKLFRRITIGPEEKLRTASERISMVDLGSISPDPFGLSPLAIQRRHDEAFNVEAVTDKFYKKYKDVFNTLQESLYQQTSDLRWSHDFALQFLNRCMFLYFIQRKRWIGENNEFMRSFWESYKSSGQTRDAFFDRWLRILFFEAFNRRFRGGHRHLPENLRNALSHAPYLNGGLFRENELDDKHRFAITDDRFEEIFEFLEGYNFTIAEDSPLDQEVAVDPEMIGRVYESLVNKSDGVDEKGDAGIFYTPRTEIDLMCRLSLVDYLSNHLGEEHKSVLYEAVFALEPDDKEAADRSLTGAKLWPKLDGLLREITVLDPACGSGSFLVGMLHILEDLQKRAADQLNKEESSYDRKMRIIGESLYGVDVMDWACHVAELRLWLALIIDAEFSREELMFRKEPLLPHFTFKVRCGDSLVQDVGGINLRHIGHSLALSPASKGRINRLKTEKLKFYNNDPTRRFRSKEEAEREERLLFRDILDERKHKIQEEIKALHRKIEGPSSAQVRLDGKIEEKAHQLKLQAAQWQKEIESLNVDLDRINSALAALRDAKGRTPFVWEIGFVEVFEGEKGGFDIVIGNPPYVRQENISDPRTPREGATAENKKAYKERLVRSVYQAYPRFFGCDQSRGTASRKLEGRSDLYIYFYLHGLSLLNDKGTFCFITSNSWLDVGYGKDLQEFLLKHCHIKMVIDNQARRSFSRADVNTVIALLSAPDEASEWGLEKTARFVMFKEPVEHIISPVIFEEIEEAGEVRSVPDYRVFPVSQKALLEEGSELPGGDEVVGADPRVRPNGKNKTSGPLIKGTRYIGNKWGGKYLRAPDIFFTILEKGKGKLVRLGDIAEVRFGIKTGCNEFFYLPSKHFDIKKSGKYYELIPKYEGLPKGIRIEENCLRPVIKSSRECESFQIEPASLKQFLFLPPSRSLKSMEALSYVSWGQSKDFHSTPTSSARSEWWFLGVRRVPDIISPCSVSELYRAFDNNDVYADKRLYEVYVNKNEKEQVLLSLCSTIITLFLEVGSRTGLGLGLLDLTVYEVADCLIIHPNYLAGKRTQDKRRKVNGLIELGINPNRPIRERRPDPLPDRKALDDIVFDILGLTQDERDEVYWAVCELVQNRLSKARSV